MPSTEVEVGTVEVPLQDLTIIRAALNSAYHQNTVIDLAEQYRKLTQRFNQSKLTQGLNNALALVNTYIELGESSEEETPDE